MATSDSQQALNSEAAGSTGGLAPPPSSSSTRSSQAKQNIRQLLIVVSFVAMVIVFWRVKSDTFLTSQNIQNLINGMPILTMLALAVTVVLILGEFDLSVPNTASLGTIIIAILATQTSMGIAIAILLGGFIVAIAAGAMNGTAVGYGRAPAFVVTLAVGSIAAGVELFVQTKIRLGQTAIPVSSLPTSLQTLSTSHIAGFELAVFMLIIVAVVIGIVMVFTPWGRHVQAIGGNETAARLAGVPVRRTKVMAFTLTGLLAGFAGILFTARNGYFANALPPYLLPAYAAAFFGAAGVGRRGFSIPATVFGALYLQVLSNGLTVLNEPQWVISVVQGVVLFVAVLLARLGGSGA